MQMTMESLRKWFYRPKVGTITQIYLIYDVKLLELENFIAFCKGVIEI